MTKSFRTFLIWLTLGAMAVSAFFIRLNNSRHCDLFAIDELVYARMAAQINHEGLSGYNTVPYGREMAAAGRDLPEYFFQPLFKYPPFFTLSSALSMKIFGRTMEASLYPTLLYSVLLIPLTYALAMLVTGSGQIAFLAAIFMWLDPVMIVTSQKVFPDTTIAFFSLLSIYLYLYGILKNKPKFFFLGGFVCGIAVLTKYPGILPVFAIAIYTALKKRELYSNRDFLFSLSVPFLMLIPWFYWNYLVYGTQAFVNFISVNNLGFGKKRTIVLCLLFALFIVTALINVLRKKFTALPSSPKPSPNTLPALDPKFRRWAFLAVEAFFFLLCMNGIVAGLIFDHVPDHGWQQGLFYKQGPLFYFNKLMEYSFIFTLAFSAYFFNSDKNTDKKLPLMVPGTVLIFFYMAWGSYQSRYILTAIPLFMILGVQIWMELLDQVSASKNGWVRFGCRILLQILLIYIIIKTYYLDIVFSYPSNMCYY